MTTPLQATLAAIDAINKQDPNIESDGEQEWPKESLYSHRMSERLTAFCPDAPETLQIAARAQHIARWQISRSDYPMDKSGYKRWRTELGKMHATKTVQIMAEFGYSQTDQNEVTQLLTKKGIKSQPHVQTLEDVICLVFIEHYLAGFAAKHEHSKLIDIIQKTWRKMSKDGHSAALKLPLPEPTLALVQEALA